MTEMQAPVRQLKETARKVAKVTIECGIVLDEEEYVGQFHTDMVNAMFQWAEGAKFGEICKLTDIFEGSIIRIIRREEELLR